MKINLILGIFFIVAVFGSIGGASYYYVQSLEFSEYLIYDHVESIAQSRAEHVETFLEAQKILAANLALIEKVETLLLTSKSDSAYNAKKIATEERLQKTVDSIEQIKSIGVIDENNILIVSTDSELVGTDYSETAFFVQNLERIAMIRFVEDPNFGLVLGVISPVKDDSGKYLGMVGLALDLEELNEITLDKTGIGNTGETYLINNESYALTPLLFEPNAIRRFKVDSINARNCLDMMDFGTNDYMEHEQTQILLDYRGSKVIGTHFPILEQGWCLLAEIDESEILKRQKEFFQGISFLMIIVIIAIVILTGFFVGRFFEKSHTLKKSKKKLK